MNFNPTLLVFTNEMFAQLYELVSCLVNLLLALRMKAKKR